MNATLKTAGLLVASLALVGKVHAAGLPIQGSKHDFTVTYVGASGGAKTLCSTCHEMHKPVKMKPLWARNNPDATLVWKVNKSGVATTLPATYVENPQYALGVTTATTSVAIPVGAFVDGRSGLCLSCHDGTQPVANGMYINGSPTTTSPNFGGSDLSKNHTMGRERGLYDRYGNLTPLDVLKLNDTVVINASNGTPVTRYFIGCTTCHGIHDSVPTNQKLLRNDFATGSGPVCWNCHAGK
ncbi:MAG: cytochrome c3 family protein [Elusimicrobiota bacterium]